MRRETCLIKGECALWQHLVPGDSPISSHDIAIYVADVWTSVSRSIDQSILSGSGCFMDAVRAE